MEERGDRAIALGFFDGVHLGHQALLRRTAERAGDLGLAPALLTFDRSPREFVTGTPVPLLTTVRERSRAARELFPGMEIIAAPFDPAVQLEGVTVSSTHIRALLERGEAEEAARFLGRPFAISGLVRHGKRLGSSRLGAPTVNLIPDPRQLVPAFGVYAARVTVDGAARPAVTNVGVRPTVDTDGGVTVESHLLEPIGELYGADCRVEFLKMLRPEMRFAGLEALRAQIARDAGAARAFFCEAENKE